MAVYRKTAKPHEIRNQIELSEPYSMHVLDSLVHPILTYGFMLINGDVFPCLQPEPILPFSSHLQASSLPSTMKRCLGEGSERGYPGPKAARKEREELVRLGSIPRHLSSNASREVCLKHFKTRYT